MPSTIIKTPEAHDFLALVPQLVGFAPENSMVLVAFRGNRTCGALRFTLPEPSASHKVHKRIATTLIGTLCKIPGVDAVVPVAYTDASFAEVTGLPFENFADVLVKRAELSGFLVRDALCVAADAWGSYLDPHCPASGRPLSDILDSTVNQGIPDSARRGLGTLFTGTELPHMDLAVKERLARVYRRYDKLFGEAGTLPELVRMVGDILDPVDAAEAALDWNPEALELEDAAMFLFLVQSPANRDQMTIQFAFGEEAGIEAYEVNAHYGALQRSTGKSLDEIVQAEIDAGVPETRRSGDYLLGLTAERPIPERIDTAIKLLKTIVAMAPRSARPAPLCMLAWLSWALGSGSVAGLFVDQALKIDPEYGMALVLSTLFGTGHLPDWAFEVPFETDHS